MSTSTGKLKVRKCLAILFAVVGIFSTLTILLAVLGLVATPPPERSVDQALPAATASPASAASRDGTCIADDVNDVEYLIFWPPLPGATPGTYGSIDDFVRKLGTTGDGKIRQLGIGAAIPVWLSDEATIVQAIKTSFDTARRTNVAVHFNVDDHIEWDKRPDLWNWYDPARSGYNPDNRKNVEWYDWDGTANKRRYFSPEGAPSQSPHMCYNSPSLQSEISRIVSRVAGPALRQEIDRLKRENKEYLFAGITVGSEAGFDDYSMVLKLAQIPSNADMMQKLVAKMMMQAVTMMDKDKAPYSRLGYCALTNAGYSKSSPPADINQALTDVNQKFIKFWNRLFFDAGIPCSRLYTHVAASSPQDRNNNAPIGIVFNPYARPGWTTYPIGTLQNGFQPIYSEVAKHGNSPWGGVEANATLNNPNAPTKISWERYLAWHYNYGAKLVGINIGAADQSIMSSLSRGAFGEEAMAAYKKFLSGEKLIEK